MTHTQRTQTWLSERWNQALAHSMEEGYEPLYGSAERIGRMPVGHIVALARSYAILQALAAVEFESCLDVGCGGGRLAHLVERLYGVRCAGVDLVPALAGVARRDFGLPTYVADAAVLPFADQQFDLVVCSEVLEHVEHPFGVLAELRRVARRTVLITTQEVCRSPWQRRLQMAGVERQQPHAERNYFVYDDFRRAFGPTTEIQPLLYLPERVRLFPRESVADLVACIRALAAAHAIGRGSFGVVAIARREGTAVAARPPPDGVLETLLETDRLLDAQAAERGANPIADVASRCTVPLLAPPLPVCPECGGSLAGHAEAPVHCHACRRIFPTLSGVPILLGSAAALARRSAAWAGRTEIEPVRRALGQQPLPSHWMRAALRWFVKTSDFLQLPLPWRDKARLVRRYFAEL